MERRCDWAPRSGAQSSADYEQLDEIIFTEVTSSRGWFASDVVLAAEPVVPVVVLVFGGLLALIPDFHSVLPVTAIL